MAYIDMVAKYLPKNRVTNDDLKQFPERYRNLIAEKAGIVTRYYATENQCTSDIGAMAVKELLGKIDVQLNDIDAIICATSSPDRIQPATATRIQAICGVDKAFAFDINSVCSGALYAITVANALVDNGARNIIVVASEVYSKILNPNDITNYPYFGDGSAATLVTNTGKWKFVDSILYSDGNGADTIQVAAGGTKLPRNKNPREKDFYFSMIGSEVYNFACAKGVEVINKLMTRNNINPDRVITHQANINIIKEIAKNSQLDEKKFFVNIEKYANTAGASVLIALEENLTFNPNDQHIFLVAFGGGLSWGGVYLKCVK